MMSMVDKVISSLDVLDKEDMTTFQPRHGYLYCMKTNIVKTKNGEHVEYVKLGKTLTKQNETEDDVRNRLFSRYKTYYPETVIMELIKVRNADKAERELFEMLKDLRVTNELFVYQPMRLDETLQTLQSKYADISVYLKQCSIEEIDYLNKWLYNKYKTNDNMVLN